MWVAVRGATAVGEPPVLREAKSAVGRVRVRRVRRDAVPACSTPRRWGGPSLVLGENISVLLSLGYFEGLDSERGIAWRRLRMRRENARFSVSALTEGAPDHSTISRTRRLIDLDTHRAVFTWGVQCLGIAGLVKGKTIAIDATTLERTRPCAASCAATPERSITTFLTEAWHRPPALKPRRAPIWRSWIASARTKDQTRSAMYPHDLRGAHRQDDGWTHPFSAQSRSMQWTWIPSHCLALMPWVL